MLALGCDHVGLLLKVPIQEYLQSRGIEVIDFGCFSSERTDYPNYALEVGKAVVEGRCVKGLLFCGTGIGISISANKIRGIRAAVCSEPYSSKLSRMHNDTNVLCLGSRVVGIDLAKMIIDEWLGAEFEGGRHSQRIEMIAAIEANQAKG